MRSRLLCCLTLLAAMAACRSPATTPPPGPREPVSPPAMPPPVIPVVPAPGTPAPPPPGTPVPLMPDTVAMDGGAPRSGADRQAEAAFRALARALWELGGSTGGRTSEIDQQLSRGPAGFAFEAIGPAQREDLGDALFGSAPPRPAEIDAAYRRHCRPTSAPERTGTPEGYQRTTYRGVELRSGARCVLVTDVRADGRWRFVLRIRRGPG